MGIRAEGQKEGVKWSPRSPVGTRCTASRGSGRDSVIQGEEACRPIVAEPIVTKHVTPEEGLNAAGSRSGTHRHLRGVDTEVFAHFKLHAIDLSENSGGRGPVIRRAGLDPAQ